MTGLVVGPVLSERQFRGWVLKSAGAVVDNKTRQWGLQKTLWTDGSYETMCSFRLAWYARGNQETVRRLQVRLMFRREGPGGVAVLSRFLGGRYTFL